MGNPFFRDFDLLILGELFTEFSAGADLTSVGSFNQNVGGSDVYTAVSAARQGAKTGLISSIARDPTGHIHSWNLSINLSPLLLYLPPFHLERERERVE